MTRHNCEKCPFRARYDTDPNSILGRIWRWHISWCPGWKKYMASLPGKQQTKLIDQYGINRNIRSKTDIE